MCISLFAKKLVDVEYSVIANSSLDNSLRTLSYYMHILSNGSYYAARNFSIVLYVERL